MDVTIQSNNARYSEDFIEAKYEYLSTKVDTNTSKYVASAQKDVLHIRTQRIVPKVGLMLVGWGGNNGSTLTAALLANKYGLSWRTKTGVQQANWYGSITQASTVRLGMGANGEDVYVPFSSMLPMLNPDDIILDGWDISNLNLYNSMRRAQVLDTYLQDQLEKDMTKMRPRPGIYNADFIAANQNDRANNLIPGTKHEQMEQICKDIDDFKTKSGVDKVIIIWSANTERMTTVISGVNDSMANLKTALLNNHPEISPSTIFAYAAILKKCTYINGSPQNTFVPGIVEMAEANSVFISGDDFKSGQTKLKSVLVDFLINAGIKPVSIVSYNHLGNNDGKNLSAPAQFISKEISKSNVVDDMVASNNILYKPGEKPDHCVVIKYVPYVGDSKRAMDEYTSEIMMGGHNTLVVHNTCEDSLLASPIILDLLIIAELATRIHFKKAGDVTFSSFHPVLSLLSYLCKAPIVPHRAPVVNALFKQRACIENVLRACLGLPADNNMLLEHKIMTLMPQYDKQETDKYIINQNGYTKY